MPRIRSIKPEFFTNDALVEAGGIEGQLLFAGLWCQADREGRLEDRPLLLKTRIMPYHDVDVDDLLTRLATYRDPFIVRYEVDGKRFIQIVNFLRHQYPNVKEPKSVIPPLPAETAEHHASTMPAPCQHDTSTSLKGLESKEGNGGDTREENSTLIQVHDALLAAFGAFPNPKQAESLRILVDRYPDAVERIEWGIRKALESNKPKVAFAIACAETASKQELESDNGESGIYDDFLDETLS